MTPPAGLDTIDPLTVQAWQDPIVDRLGHDPRSRYCELFWLPVLGPSTLCLLRHLVARLEVDPEACHIDLADTARAIGLGERPGRNGPFARTVARAVDFDMARLNGSVLAVRRRIPPLPRRHLARLPESARAEHERLVARGEDRGAAPLEQKARQLALSLARLGEDTEATERQLRRWRFEADVARECARWATAVAQHPATQLPAAQHPSVGASRRPAGSAPAAAGGQLR